MTKTAVVIGSGIVGLCSALRLAQAGWRVRIADPRAPGEGCSAGNPGGVSVSSILPAAAPGVVKKVPGWLLDPEGPLSIRPTYLPRLAPWLVRFLRASSPDRYRQGMENLYALTRTAQGAWIDLLASIGETQTLRRDGHLIVYRSREQFDVETASWQRRQKLGLNIEEIDTDDLAALVPALSAEYRLARKVLDNGWLVDPLAVCRSIAAQLAARGAAFERQAVQDLAVDASGRPRLTVGGREIAADLVVLAAGAWSARLARRVGDKVALQPERGYSVTWDKPGFSVPMPVFSPSEKIMAGPTRGGIRFAGTAEFTGFDSPPNWKRAEALERLGRRMFPGLTKEIAGERWIGLRPSTPDGLPVLGPSRSSDRIIHAFGHGHVGVTTAAVTADIVRALAERASPTIDLAPYDPGRFSSTLG
ncbi:NAD(P)/FAD-dependent oxidoreductase [Rhizobium halophytocola]|uniref:D-amino-acid dehydrogenase n=1 Tax=Rhizobium halophytocola TaxID=735519 RepID=A0ABS4DUL6_9HYPH|nr:FAD-dependent oxidoreductase [Rhizobium halophytocola]MBP1849369.1 D-amino-acid dehydrogenase [Rhizobium halophytocola]